MLLLPRLPIPPAAPTTVPCVYWDANYSSVLKVPTKCLSARLQAFINWLVNHQTPDFAFIFLTGSSCLSVAPSWRPDAESTRRSVLCPSPAGEESPENAAFFPWVTIGCGSPLLHAPTKLCPVSLSGFINVKYGKKNLLKLFFQKKTFQLNPNS